MRPTRKRAAAKLDDDFVDLDSDELDEAIEKGSVNNQQSSRQSRRQKQKSVCAEDDLPAAQLPADDEDYVPEDAAAVEPSGLVVAAAAEGAEQAAAEQPAPADEDDEAAGSDQPVSGDEEDEEEDEEDQDEEADNDSDSQGNSKKKKPSKQPKQKKPRKKKESTARLCVTYAKAQFRLTDRDLDELTDVEYKRNPHYRYGPPMRLYLIRELEELAKRKEQRMAHMLETKEQRAAERAMEMRARKAAAAAAAAEAAKSFDVLAHADREHHGSVTLPDTCLIRIMSCLVEGLEPGGLRGPSAIAKDLGAASLVCWDFYHACKVGFVALGEATAGLQQVCCRSGAAEGKRLTALHELPGPDSLGGWPFWDSVLRNPTQLKLPQLKLAAKHLNVMVTGTKAEIMLRCLGAFGLTAPTTAPAQLLRALVLERNTHYLCWDGPEADSGLVDKGCQVVAIAISRLRAANDPAAVAAGQQQHTRGVAGWRSAIAAGGYNSITDFIAAGQAEYDARVRQQREEAYRRMQEARQRAMAAQRAAEERYRAAAAAAAAAGGGGAAAPGTVAGPHPYMPGVRPVGLRCPCGNMPGQSCARGCCRPCCFRMGRSFPGQPHCHQHWG